MLGFEPATVCNNLLQAMVTHGSYMQSVSRGSKLGGGGGGGAASKFCVTHILHSYHNKKSHEQSRGCWFNARPGWFICTYTIIGVYILYSSCLHCVAFQINIILSACYLFLTQLIHQSRRPDYRGPTQINTRLQPSDPFGQKIFTFAIGKIGKHA